MANIVKEKKKEGKLIMGRFPLSNSPLAVQLTIHINNMFITWPKQKKDLLRDFKGALNGSKEGSKRAHQLIDHYGMNFCKQWFKDIYGWEFKQEDVA